MKEERMEALRKALHLMHKQTKIENKKVAYQQAVQMLAEMQEMRPPGSMFSPQYDEWRNLRSQQAIRIKELRWELLKIYTPKEIVQFLHELEARQS